MSDEKPILETFLRKRIAILFHEHDRGRDLTCYAITFLAEYWRADGHDVRLVFGTKKFIPADLAILHVDLSVIPDEYLAFAQRYPLTLNGAVKDIRKSTFSRNLVTPDDPYGGRVIVKSDLNYAGLPERVLHRSGFSTFSGRVQRLWSRYHLAAPDRSLQFNTPTDYRIYESRREVPRAYFKRSDLVIEKFLPEVENGFYHVRIYQFLGDRETWTRLAARHPIVNDRSRIGSETVEPHPEIIELRKGMKFDYGKFDYVVHGGKTVLLDTNKTTGADAVRTPELEAMRRHRADGIYSYFS